MCPDGLKGRMDTAIRFADQTHPLITSAFYSRPVTEIREKVTRPLIHPVRHVPDPMTFEVRLEDGHQATCRELDEKEGTGLPVVFYDGYIAKVIAGERFVELFIDTSTDVHLAGIIHTANEQFKKNPDWSASRKMFQISLLCFGDHKLKRYPLESFGSDRFYLGELVSTVDIGNFECVIFSLACQVVAQKFDLPVTWHSGVTARFSSYTRSMGPHAWQLISEHDTRVLDWTNYPESVRRIFSSAGRVNPDTLWDSFRKTFGHFPVVKTPVHPPSFNDFLNFDAGYNDAFGARNEVVYYTESEDCLYSSDLPFGWSEVY